MIESITETEEVRSNSSKAFYIALMLALLITAGVGIGMMILQRRNANRFAQQQAEAAEPVEKPKPTPELKVLLDESIVKAGKASISGTVKNLSPNPVSGISLELQLFQRKDGGTMVKTIDPAPADLPPNGEAKFSMTVSQSEFRTWRVARVVSSAANRDIAFVTDEGVLRPKEGPTTVTQTVGGRRSGGTTDGGFLNTPDTPIRVP